MAVSEWSAIFSGLAWVAALIGAILVYRRSGQTVNVQGEDSDTKRFEAISAAQDRLRVALLARLDELEEENTHQREQLEELNARVPLLEQRNEECEKKTQRLMLRVDELERILSTFRPIAGDTG